MEGWCTAREAAAYLGISVSALHRLRKRHRISGWRAGLSIVYRWSAVQALKNDPDYINRTRRRKSIADLEAAGQLVLASEMAHQASFRAQAPLEKGGRKA